MSASLIYSANPMNSNPVNCVRKIGLNTFAIAGNSSGIYFLNYNGIIAQSMFWSLTPKTSVQFYSDILLYNDQILVTISGETILLLNVTSLSKGGIQFLSSTNTPGLKVTSLETLKTVIGNFYIRLFCFIY